MLLGRLGNQSVVLPTNCFSLVCGLHALIPHEPSQPFILFMDAVGIFSCKIIHGKSNKFFLLRM